MKNFKKISYVLIFTIAALAIVLGVLVVFKNLDGNVINYGVSQLKGTAELAEEAGAVDNSIGFKAIGAGVGIGLAALGGTIAMGMATAKASESISRQPEAEGKIRSSFMLGLVFIETVVIYALIVGILIIFVL